jgi:DNA-binding MarR family transcriptional regulator
MSILQTLPWEPTSGQLGQFTARQPRTDEPFGKSGLTRRGIIYEFIRTHPGTHVRGLAKDLGLATGDLQYHLSWLEKNGYVKTVKTGFYRFVYPTMVFREEQELLLAVLSKDTQREILLLLLENRRMSQGGIARSLGCSQPTVCWHIDRLVKMGLLKRGATDGAPYEAAVDRDEVLTYVKTYHPDAWRRWSGRQRMMVEAGAQRSRIAFPRTGEPGPAEAREAVGGA